MRRGTHNCRPTLTGLHPQEPGTDHHKAKSYNGQPSLTPTWAFCPFDPTGNCPSGCDPLLPHDRVCLGPMD